MIEKKFDISFIADLPLHEKQIQQHYRPIMPRVGIPRHARGVGFVEYPACERGYEALKTATTGVSALEPTKVLSTALAEPISIVAFVVKT